MNESIERHPDWVGLPVACRRCRAVFLLDASLEVKDLRESAGTNTGSVGVRCPDCSSRLIVKYQRNWKPIPNWVARSQ